MKMFSKAGYFVPNLGGGSQSITGLGFTPKLVLFTSTPDTADIVADIANAHWSFGAFDGVAQKCGTYNSRNGVIANDVIAGFYSDRVVHISDPPGTSTPDYIIVATSLDADGFTVNVTDPPPINYRVAYIALGGASFQAKVGEFTTAGGGQAITGVGFEPECVLFWRAWSIGLTTVEGGGNPGQFCLSYYSVDGGFPSNTHKEFNTSWPHAVINTTSETHGGGVSTFDPDGFTTGYYLNPSAIQMFYIAMRGGPDIKFYATSETMPSTIGDWVKTGVPFRPRAGIFLSHGSNTGTFQTGRDQSMGFVGLDPASSMYMVENQEVHAVSPTNTAHSSHSQRTLRFLNAAGAITEDMKIVDWEHTGFRANMAVANASPSLMGYLLIGDTDGTIPPGPPEPGLSDNFGYVI